MSSLSTQASWLISEDLTALMLSMTPSHFWHSEQKWAEVPQALMAGPWMSFVILRPDFSVKTLS